jgi:hypothetical protein
LALEAELKAEEQMGIRHLPALVVSPCGGAGVSRVCLLGNDEGSDPPKVFVDKAADVPNIQPGYAPFGAED